ncbi:MAG: hypothetical protein PHV97_05435 [Candidatus Omnitrophica bacterium]|nr:hypothetical protein [Candidatus Omnitrophota bacterium]
MLQEALSGTSGAEKMIFNDDALKTVLKFVQDRYKHYPDQFLTEEDIRSFIVAELLKQENLSAIQPTCDGSWSIPIHSEIRWYGARHNLRYRSDIALIDPTDLSTKDGALSLPSKGYGYNNFWAVIEIKLRRTNGCSDNQFLKLIQKEIEKAVRVRDEAKQFNSHRATYHLLFFDKKADISNSLINLASSAGQDIFMEYVHKH